MAVNGRPTRQTLYQRLDEQIDELWSRLGGLPSPPEARDIWTGIWYAEAHHSTAIEGNTLYMKQVRALLAEGRAVGNQELSQYLEVRGYADAASWVYNQGLEPGDWSDGSLITLTEVRHIHHMAMTPVWDTNPHPAASDAEGPGSFRQHDIHPFAGGMQPPPWAEVPAHVDSWLALANDLRARRPELPEQLADMHSRFERIHPFLHGNGRTGRLILNLLLIRLGYPPAIIYNNQRETYLKALRRADQGDHGALGEFIARAVLDNLYKFVVPAVAGPARLVPLAALASDQISPGALRTAAVRGALQATKGSDGQWRSSRNWVDAYMATKYKRRYA